jgi:hypothetical protein
VNIRFMVSVLTSEVAGGQNMDTDRNRDQITVHIRMTAQQQELLNRLKTDDKFQSVDGEVIRSVFVEWLKENDLV